MAIWDSPDRNAPVDPDLNLWTHEEQVLVNQMLDLGATEVQMVYSGLSSDFRVEAIKEGQKYTALGPTSMETLELMKEMLEA